MGSRPSATERERERERERSISHLHAPVVRSNGLRPLAQRVEALVVAGPGPLRHGIEPPVAQRDRLVGRRQCCLGLCGCL